MDNQINLQLVLDTTGHVTSYSTVGGLTGATTYEGEIPAEFLTTTQPQAFKLIDNVLTKDPNYVARVPDTIQDQPSDEQQFQSQLGLQMATMQKNQDEFNAQVLLQLADIKKAATTATSETPVTPVMAGTPAAAIVTPAQTPETPATSSAATTSVTPAPATPATPTSATVETK